MKKLFVKAKFHILTGLNINSPNLVFVIPVGAVQLSNGPERVLAVRIHEYFRLILLSMLNKSAREIVRADLTVRSVLIST